MEIRFQTETSWQTDIAIFFAFEGETSQELANAHQTLIEAAPWIEIAPAWRDFKGNAKEIQILYGHKDNSISRACAIGLGKKDKLTIETLRNAIGTAIKACRSLGVNNIGLDITSLHRLAEALKQDLTYIIEESCTAALSSLYRYETWLTQTEGRKEDPKWLALLLSTRHIPDEIQKAGRLAEAQYAGIALARDLANSPANILTPSAFAEQAIFIAEKYGFKCTVFNKEQLEELGMNAFLAVAKGSAQEPRFIVLEYTPTECTQTAPYIFVGKGLTFDSGGISLKPSKGMEEMKTDMSGAADVLALFEVLGQAKMVFQPNRPIIGMIGCAENMPSGSATKPGDIVKTLNGKTVEITNTDAEGRLVLIDVLAYAQKNYTPHYLIDIATLTGACVVALGDEAAGLFCNNSKLAHKLLDCSEKAGETLWRMPLWESMLQKIKSPVADLDNSGPREGGAITAAVFIQQFIQPETIWAHLDIAGPNFTSAETPLQTKGGTAFGLKTLFELVKE